MNEVAEKLNRTPLYALHLELGAKMLPFAGFHMPLQYADGVIKEHLHTRANAGLFDVSHMAQVRISGAGAARALEALLPVDLESLAQDSQVYAVLTNEAGGILDDLIISCWGKDDFFLVLNAACKEQDIAHLRAHLSAPITIEVLADKALLALQGPKAKDVLRRLAPAADALVFMSGCRSRIDATDCYITRSGYTGEDGFEISCPADRAESIARRLLASSEVEAIGLGARDSLRLEAGLCLYGHELDVHTTPVEAALQWCIARSRRADGNKAGGFPGADVILAQMRMGTVRRRVGLRPTGKMPIRAGVELFNGAGTVVGRVTSGGFGPSLSRPIAMAYVEIEHAAPDTALNARVRDRTVAVSVSRLPFVQQNYVRA